MFWLSRPPYVRWALAALVLVTGVIIEMRPMQTVPHPFTVDSIAVGNVVDETQVVWRDVPVGLFAPIHLPVTASRQIFAGEPLLAGGGTTSVDTGIPEGWWAIELEIPAGASPGMRVRVVTPEGGAEGVIVEIRDGDFGERSGLVAVPEGAADTVAAAVLDATVAVLVGG
ncbi:MAG: hypothetical protein WD532_06990 [Acidimicrobiia bacterium]